jgi:hypothetical protein
MSQYVHTLLSNWPDITNVSKNHVTKHSHFASEMGRHDVTEHFVEGGHHVTCEKPSTSKPGWTKNTWMDRMYTRAKIVAADSSLGGRIV